MFFGNSKRLICAAAITAGAMNLQAGSTARWIGEDPEPAWDRTAKNLVGRSVGKAILPKNTVRFRRVFSLPSGEIRRAEVRSCGLGLYELWVNGRAVDPQRRLAPNWSNPDDRVLFDTTDVTALLTAGQENALGLWVATGYSDDFFKWGWRWLKPKRAWLEMDVSYADGRKVRIETDGHWEWTDATPIRQATLYHGERYDATAEESDWATARPDRSLWRSVRVLADDGLRLVPDRSVPVRLRDPRTPVEIIPLGGDRWILDFGQNRAGLIEFNLTLPRGSRVTMRHAEEIAADRRSLDVRTLRSAQQTDEYVFAGRPGGERYIPRFTYHGFRYAEVTGVPAAQMKAENFRAFAVTADVKDTATFRSSDETLNWLFNAAYWSMRSNLVGYPSDCPMRDERTPCLMDSNCFEDTACLFFDMRDYYAKWLGDAVRYQQGVDPKVRDNWNPDWSGEPMLLAERLLVHYAATNAVRREYVDLRTLTDSFLESSPSNVWHEGFGDWCPPGGKNWKDYHSSVSLVNTLFLGACCRAMAHVAEAVGETADAVRYRARDEACRKTFRTTFFDPVRKIYGDGKQTDLALPLVFGLVDEADRPAVVSRLAERIRTTDKGHFGTGIYGTRYLGDALLENGLEDLWLSVIKAKGEPGFEYMREKGATTTWEQWHWAGGMNSHNHAMKSGAAACLLTHLAGIRPQGEGRRAVRICPVFPKDLEWVEASIETACGPVSVKWCRRDDGHTVTVNVPKGLDAVLALPGCPERRLPSGMSTENLRGLFPGDNEKVAK